MRPRCKGFELSIRRENHQYDKHAPRKRLPPGRVERDPQHQRPVVLFEGGKSQERQELGVAFSLLKSPNPPAIEF